MERARPDEPVTSSISCVGFARPRPCYPPFRPFRTSIPLVLRANAISGVTAAAHDVDRGDGWVKGCVGQRLHDPARAPIGYLGRSLVPTPVGRSRPACRGPCTTPTELRGVARRRSSRSPSTPGARGGSRSWTSRRLRCWASVSPQRTVISSEGLRAFGSCSTETTRGSRSQIGSVTPWSALRRLRSCACRRGRIPMTSATTNCRASFLLDRPCPRLRILAFPCTWSGALYEGKLAQKIESTHYLQQLTAMITPWAHRECTKAL